MTNAATQNLHVCCKTGRLFQYRPLDTGNIMVNGVKRYEKLKDMKTEGVVVGCYLLDITRQSHCEHRASVSSHMMLEEKKKRKRKEGKGKE